eukprot:NODE_6924_length_522_cov_22.154334_g6493_i0.p1 GENE.NODE_6924_length_522_cov_22.154334_g6493_i0~~NODE_6924_length_522_cov_22.154334_g6493_i0.p1  ORF type:complete len:136 (+),score=18.48 NODE_6924_length_522_cov_22.154334_g6493_i0:47-454(+)
MGTASVGRVHVTGFLWGSDPAHLLRCVSSEGGSGFDVVLMSDLVFNHSCHRQLLESCDQCLRPDGVAYVSFSHHRVHKIKEDLAFLTLARDHFHFDVQKLSERLMAPMFERDPGDAAVRGTVHMYTLRKMRLMSQ